MPTGRGAKRCPPAPAVPGRADGFAFKSQTACGGLPGNYGQVTVAHVVPEPWGVPPVDMQSSGNRSSHDVGPV